MRIKYLTILCGLAVGSIITCRADDVSATVTGVSWNVIANGSTVDGEIEIGYAPHGETSAIVTIDGKEIVHSDQVGTIQWQPFVLPDSLRQIGYQVGDVVLDATYVWTNLTDAFSVSYEKLRGVAWTNITQYRQGAEWTFPALALSTPGYTFIGWTPSAITPEMTGDLTVTANWKEHTYQIVYDTNEGEGEMQPTTCLYSEGVEVSECGFTRDGYSFLGWSLEKGGDLVYPVGSEMSKLTATDGGAVTLYAVWGVLSPDVHNMKVSPLSPWGLAIDYTLDGVSEYNSAFTLRLTAVMDGITNVARSVSGAAGCMSGQHRIYWNMVADGFSGDISDAEVFVSYECDGASRGETLYVITNIASVASVAHVNVDVQKKWGVVDGVVDVGFAPDDDENAVVTVGGIVATFAGESGIFKWQPLTTGSQTFAHVVGANKLSMSLTSTNGTMCLPNNAFADCSSLVAIELPSGLKSIGAGAFANCSSLPSIKLSSGLKSIGAGAFTNCSSLPSIKLSSGLEVIGAGAFTGCSNLKRVDIPSLADWYGIKFEDEAANPLSQGATLFVAGVPVEIGGANQCDIVIPEGVTNLPCEVFAGCTNITSLVLPASLTKVSPDALVGLKSLTNLVLKGQISFALPKLSGETDWVEESFDVQSNEIIYRSNAIGHNESTAIEFEMLVGLMSATYSWRVSSEEDYDWLTVYLDGNQINQISGEQDWAIVTNSLDCVAQRLKFVYSKDIGSCAGSDCGWVSVKPRFKIGSLIAAFPDSTLASVTLDDAWKTIPEGFFADCSNLVSIVLSEGITEIGDRAFEDCSSLKDITIPSTVEDFGDNDFCEIGVRAGLEEGLWIQNGWVLGYIGTAGAEVEIPEGVKGIAAHAFEDQYLLEKVTLPSTLVSIEKEAFRRCTNLESVDLPEGVVSIGDGAFQDCTYVKEVSLPSTLRHVGSSAFANTTSLGKVAFMDGIEDIGDGAFSNSWRMISISLPASVTNIGENAFWNCKNLTGVTTPTHLMPISELFSAAYSNLTAISISEGETMMVSNAFAGCVALEGIAMPSTVANISECAFENCGALKKVNISAAVTNIGARAFAGCSGIAEIEFPDGLRTIGENAFEGLTLLEEIVLPKGIEELGANAFTNCAAIRSVTIPGGVCSIKSVFSSAYSKLTSVTITTNTTVLCRDFLHDCSSLTSIEIPEAVTNICAWALSGCSGLTEITFPDGLQAIEDHAFYYCSGLTEIIFPDGLQTIGRDAFSNCERISKITFPEGLQLIGDFAFSSLYALTDVDIPRGVTSIGYCAFGWCSVRRVTMPGDVCRVKDVFYNCGGLLEVNVTAGTTHLVDGFYEGCSGLTEVGIPAGITEIGTGLFRGCSGLTRVALPDGLTSLPDDTFTNCTSLASIVIPASVTNVGARVFSGCTSLKSVQFLGDAPTVAALAYAGVQSDLVTYVTDGSRGWDGIAMSKALPETWPSDASNAIKTWEPKKMTVTFDAQGGEPAITNLEEVTDTTYRLPEIEPTRVGATFAGWWSEIKAGAEVRPTTRVVLTGDHTFYAHWDFHQYTIAFDANGGAGEMTSVGRTVGDGEKELPRSIFKRVDYDFAGWAMEPEGAIVFEDEEAVSDLTYEDAAVITLYAVWTERTWTARDYLGRPEGVTFAEVSDVPWVRDLDVTTDGDGSMRSGAIGAADEGKKNETMLTASVVGEGQVSFQWKVSCEPSDEEGTYFDYVAFAVDGTIVAQMAGEKDWTKVTHAITGAGEHTLAWTFVRDDYDEDETLYENAAWVDELVWEPNEVVVSFDLGGIEGTAPAAVTNIAGAAILLPDVSALGGTAKRFTGWSDGAAVYAAGDSYVFGSADVTLTAQWEAREWTLAEALDAEASGLVFTTGGDAAWVVDFATNHTGAAAIRSGAITHSQTSWVETTVEGPGKLSFWMKIYGERYRNKDCDVGTCTLDGTQVYSAATNDWTNIVVTVTGEGTHTIRWAYTKNASRTAEYDCAWLDEVVWTAQQSSEAFPAVSDDTGVSSALEGAKDTKLSERIKTAAEYATFKTWVDGIAKEDLTARKAVKDSEMAWFAYALDLSVLPEKAPESLTIDTIGALVGGGWNLEVKVEDVKVGEEASAADLGTVFVVEGAAELKEESFSSENVTTTFSATGDGKLKVEVEPKSAAGQFFIRVKMTP